MMGKLFGLIIVVLVVMVALPMLQTCNVPALQAQAMIEQAHANSETAKAAQQAANSANTLAWTLGGSVALVVVGLVALVGLFIWTRVRHELAGDAAFKRQAQMTLLQQQAGAQRAMMGMPQQAQQLPAGDPMQQLIQLQVLQAMQNMQQAPRRMPSQLPVSTETPDVFQDW